MALLTVCSTFLAAAAALLPPLVVVVGVAVAGGAVVVAVAGVTVTASARWSCWAACWAACWHRSGLRMMLSMRTSARRNRPGRCCLNLLTLARQLTVLEPRDGRLEPVGLVLALLLRAALDACGGLLVGFDRGGAVTSNSAISWRRASWASSSAAAESMASEAATSADGTAPVSRLETGARARY